MEYHIPKSLPCAIIARGNAIIASSSKSLCFIILISVCLVFFTG